MADENVNMKMCVCVKDTTRDGYTFIVYPTCKLSRSRLKLYTLL